jgi:outer membrane receptor protein involved in Fe transport
LAVYGADPLRSRSVTDGGELRMALNGTFGRWSSSFNASHSETKNVYDTRRATIAGPIPLDDSFNPFASSLSGLIGITTDRSRYRSTTDLAQLSVTGPLFELPAGPVQTTLEGRLRWYRLQSRSTFSADSNRNFGRDEQAIRGAIDLPITSRQLTPQIGDLSASAEYARVHFSDAGSMSNYGFGLTWNPNQILRMRASIDRSENAPLIQLLGSPVVETPGVRVFDPQTGETVDVTLISGGNPNLRPERATTRSVSAVRSLEARL